MKQWHCKNTKKKKTIERENKKDDNRKIKIVAKKSHGRSAKCCKTNDKTNKMNNSNLSWYNSEQG